MTEGTISFEGQQLQGLSPREWKALRGKKLSMIFQDSGAMLNPIRTIGSQFREYIRTHSSLSKKRGGALSKGNAGTDGAFHRTDILKPIPFSSAEVNASEWVLPWL